LRGQAWNLNSDHHLPFALLSAYQQGRPLLPTAPTQATMPKLPTEAVAESFAIATAETNSICSMREATQIQVISFRGKVVQIDRGNIANLEMIVVSDNEKEQDEETKR
jgi:hypothetical protein